MPSTAPSRIRGAAAGVAVIALLSACSATAASENQAATRAAPSPSATSPSPSISLAPTDVPDADSTLPVGSYRTRITREELVAAGADDLQWAGTWTLVVAPDATYELKCRVLTNVANDCGNAGVGGQATVEAGRLHGTGSTVWFLDDRNHATYLLDWSVKDDALTLSHYAEPGRPFLAQGQVNNFILKPWSRISG